MNAIEAIINEIDKKVVQLQDAVGAGRCASFEEYKGICGELKGLLFARGYALDMKERIERSENE
jgi:hypothetical protein